MGWNWRSEGDMMVNGAFFTPSGAGTGESYALASSTGAKPAFFVESITADAGVLGVPKPEESTDIGDRIAVSDAVSTKSSPPALTGLVAGVGILLRLLTL
eukprot:TRINITY_DN6952_c0_g1_i2.p4 TRINITY_DN6952_c0_g1~~TRINITY_DN6952_c0_g1_i2.p4  ORF type:complete len:100 (-),score=8.05 TRINITY_DN6952_c0_g1_i2:276-575(-)